MNKNGLIALLVLALVIAAYDRLFRASPAATADTSDTFVVIKPAEGDNFRFPVKKKVLGFSCTTVTNPFDNTKQKAQCFVLSEDDRGEGVKLRP